MLLLYQKLKIYLKENAFAIFEYLSEFSCSIFVINFFKKYNFKISPNLNKLTKSYLDFFNFSLPPSSLSTTTIILGITLRPHFFNTFIAFIFVKAWLETTSSIINTLCPFLKMPFIFCAIPWSFFCSFFLKSFRYYRYH